MSKAPLQFIVAELSKGWVSGMSRSSLALGELFELAIEENRRRGYTLRSWKMSRVMVRPHELNETIIAVFELVGNA
jgi:hypothetical protein